VLAQNLQQAVEGSFRPAGNHNLRAGRTSVGDIFHRLIEDIDPAAVAGIDGVLGPARAGTGRDLEYVAPLPFVLDKRRQAERLYRVERGGKLGRPEIETFGRHGLVGCPLGQMPLARRSRVQPSLVIVAHQLGALLGRLAHRMVGDDQESVEIVEYGVEVIMEERQPVLHAGIAAALGYRRIQGVVAGRRAEEREIVLAEAADRLRRQRDFAHRIEIERAGLTNRALAGRVEGADRFQGVTEEVEPHGLFGTRNEDIENAAAHGKFADLPDCRDAFETVLLEARGDILHAHLISRAGGKCQALDDLRGYQLLQHWHCTVTRTMPA